MSILRTVGLVPLLLSATLNCRRAPQPPQRPAAAASRYSSAGASDETVQWTIGDRFGIGVTEGHKPMIVRLWQFDPTATLLDTLVVPPLGSEEVFVGSYCSRDHVPDPALFAVAVYADEPVYHSIHKAWRADTSGRHIVAVSPRGVECDNEGSGA